MINRRMKRKIILTFFIILFVCMFPFYIQKESQEYMGTKCISKKEVDEFICNKQEVSIVKYGGLQINGIKAPYDREKDMWYIPQNLQDEWQGQLSVAKADVYLRLLENEGYYRKKDAIQNNVCFEFIAYDDVSYAKGQLIFTGIPAVTINSITMNEQSTYGEIKVFDPETELGGYYEIQESYANYHVRGGSSRSFDKKSYKIDLVESNGSKKQSSFLGMRHDNEWCLQSLYTDPNRIRDKLNSDLWNEVCEYVSNEHMRAFHMKYVEVFMDDSYQGIYGMMEPIDYQQLNLDKDKDILYKIQSWMIPSEEDFLINQNAENCGGAELKSSNRVISAELWNPYKQYVKYIFQSSEEESVKFIQEHMNLDNIISLGLFIDFLSGGDNRSKNTYIAAIKEESGYQYVIVPWDMDLTWGLGWDGDSHTHSNFSMKRAKRTIHEVTFAHLWESELYQKRIMDMWNELRANIFTEENLLFKIDSYTSVLNHSGAIHREITRWPDSECTTDVVQLKKWIKEHIENLDKFYCMEGVGDKSGIS